jgi:ABC-type polysaccharide/polyol phosphate export permease
MPLTHGVQAARDIVAGASLADVSGLIGHEALAGLIYGAVGYVLLRLFEAESRRRATLDLL